MSPPTTITTTTTTSCWERMGCLEETDECVNNLNLLLATKEKRYDKCKVILEDGKTFVDTREKTTKRTALHYAACLPKVKILELLLKYNANCNAQDSLGNTPLHLAIEKKQLKCCNIILQEEKLHINMPNQNQDTPLHLAANRDFQDILDKLLKLDADLKATNKAGNTPLHLAAAQGYHGCCEKLLNKGGITNIENDENNTPLHLAAKAGHSQVVELLKSFQADCNAKNSLGETPLHLAISEDHVNCFQKLLEYNNLSINSTKKDGLTPLHYAAKTGNAEILRQLLSHGADCNATNHSGDTPLHLGAAKGNLSCCEELLGCSNLDVNKTNSNKEAPLHLAASSGRRDVCNLILQHPKIDIDIKNKSNSTPLHLAAKNSKDDVVEILLAKGADWMCRDKYAYMPIHYAAENGAKESCQHLVKALNEDKNRKKLKLTLRDLKTPLMLAAKQGFHKCCSKLIFDNINEKDKHGNSALMYAIEGRFLRTVKVLLEHGASTKITNKKGETVLHQAAKAKADECLSHLLTLDTESLMALTENKKGFTPLHEAISNEALTCATILLDRGTSVWEKCKEKGEEMTPLHMVKCKEGMTPLHLAAKQGDPGLCSLLCRDKGMLNMENNDNQTPLHVAAKYGCRDVCRVLLRKKGLHVFAKDKKGCTALHLAAEKGHYRVLKLLTKKGVSLSEVDDDGCTALHMAARNGHLECCKILVNTGRSLIHEEDGQENLPVDVAFEKKWDEVFAFLMKNLSPLKEDFTNASLKNYKWASHFHKYMHQSLQAEEPRLIAAEAIIDSSWWEAAFFSQETGNPGEDNHYCNIFHELVKWHPSLALKTQNRCKQHSTDDKVSYDFRLFEDNYCPEIAQRRMEQRSILSSSQRLLQQHPLSLMVKHTRTELLQHSLIEEWLKQLWKAYLIYIFVFLLIIEVLFLASLQSFMAYTENWAQVKHDCNNTTYEMLCGSEAHLPLIVTREAYNITAAPETMTVLPSKERRSTQCQNIVSSNKGMWFFLLVMTAIIVGLELMYIYRLQTWYFKSKRLLRFFQVSFTMILLPPFGICGLQHQTWIWTTWQWHCGLLGLLLEWLLFISMLNQLPVLFVFMPVTKNFFFSYIKALAYILLVLFAFSHIFHLLLFDKTSFQSWPESMIMMIVWLLGDYGYDDTFQDLVYPHMGRLMFVVFIIVVLGFIANLAVTLPSDRLSSFQRRAEYFRMESQSTLFLEMKACFPQLWEWNTKCLGSNIIFFNVLTDRLAKKIMTMDMTHEKSLPEDNPLQNLEQQVAMLVNLCTEQAEELKDLKNKIDNLFTRIPEPKPLS